MRASSVLTAERALERKQGYGQRLQGLRHDRAGKDTGKPLDSSCPECKDCYAVNNTEGLWLGKETLVWLGKGGKVKSQALRGRAQGGQRQETARAPPGGTNKKWGIAQHQHAAQHRPCCWLIKCTGATANSSPCRCYSAFCFSHIHAHTNDTHLRK